MVREGEIKMSLQDRMKKLQANSGDSWRRNLSKPDFRSSTKNSSVTNRLSMIQKKNENKKFTDENKNSDTDSTNTDASADKAKKPLKVQNLINNIRMDSERWKCRRGKQNDADQFTTENKLSKVKQLDMKIPIITPKVRRDVLVLPKKDEAVLSEKDVRGSSVKSLNGLSKISELAKRGLEDNCIKKRRGKRMEVPQMCDENIDSFFDISHAKIPSSTPAAKPPPKKQQKARERKKLSETLDESVFSSLSAVSSLTSLSSGEEDDDVISGMSDSEVSEVQNCSEEKPEDGEEKPENSEEKPENGERLASEDSFEDVVPGVNNFFSKADSSKLEFRRSVRRNTKQRKSQKNPLKALAARNDLQTSYVENHSNIVTLEEQRLSCIRGNASMTSSALAGLASREDIRKVKLKSREDRFTKELQPWKKLMLLRVKGRRHVQTRLVEPCHASLNSGDAYLLVTSDKLYAWFGQYSNVIEKAKVQEIADYIIHQGDLGSTARNLTVYNENSKCSEFWPLIGGKGEYPPSGGDEDDERFEISAETCIKSYQFESGKLVPFDEAWGKLPTMQLLKSDKTFVFDFGAEMYVWQGKEIPFEERQLAVKLAKVLWEQGYDYTDYKFVPFLPSDKCTVDLKGPRPDWGLFARVNENIETSLFQEKFEDWSNIKREVGEREDALRETSRGEARSEMRKKIGMKPDMAAGDVARMKEKRSRHRPIMLEGYDLWAGEDELYDEDGRGIRVNHKDVKVWIADGSEIEEDKNDSSLKVLYKTETCVVRWRYNLSSTGKFSPEVAEKNKQDEDHFTSDLLKGSNMKGDTGRDRTSYFMWKGTQSSNNEQGASALLTVDLDIKKSAPQIPVSEGNEPPLFAKLFRGNLIIQDGKRNERFYDWRLFIARGDSLERGYLYQVPCKLSSLRSTCSFLFLHVRKGGALVWNGCKSPQVSRNIANHIATTIKESRLKLMGFRPRTQELEIENIDEGEEEKNEKFKEAIMFMRRERYRSLLDVDQSPSSICESNQSCARMWHMTNQNDQFVARPLELMVSSKWLPHTSDQLNGLSRPALVMVESMEGVYLWESTSTETSTGSSKRQHDIIKRLALETCLNYIKEHRSGEDIETLHISEGEESIKFKSAFDVWIEEDKDDPISRKKKEDDRFNKKPKDLSEVLRGLSRLTYTLEELREDKLPEGVDPNHLETYLSGKDFDQLFEMSKEDFYSLPVWKQVKLRKEKNLY